MCTTCTVVHLEGFMSLTALRLAVAATLVIACTGAAMIASQKSATTMQKAATHVSRQPVAGSKGQGGVRVRQRGTPALAFHSQRDVPAQGPDDQGDERDPAPPGARSAAHRPELARIRQGHAPSSSSKTSSRRPRPAASSRATKKSICSRCLARRRRRAVGLARSKDITFRFASPWSMAP